ncbi:MAG TPA: CapA family protein [Candidatus Brocadiia bacterium]|nr:CapA family protein [Planctomycetota bacterium]MDO8093540.1 CapA family protein [Candidatus Brocadiales bacterium]
MKLLFVGDVMLGRLVNDSLKSVSPEYPWGDTLPLFKATDVRICNLECVIADSGEPIPKTFNFRSDAKNIAVLKTAHIDMVSLANNHALDYGPEALEEMIGHLDDAGIAHAGAGVNAAAARASTHISVHGATVALLSFTDYAGRDWEAGRETPGVRYCPVDLENVCARVLIEDVRMARVNAEIVVTSAHWGSNWGYAPEKEHQKFAHALIEAGADIVFGHSAHVFRGIELFKGRLIIYSAGDFIDDYAIDKIERNDESFVFVVEFNDSRVVRIRMYPIIIDNFQARLAPYVRAKTIATRMEALSKECGTTAWWNEEIKALEIIF